MIGLSLCTYPIISNLIELHIQKNTISTYNSHVIALDDSQIKSALHQAQQYNDALSSTFIPLKTDYNQILNFENTGIMGTIEIPQIDVYLPIYHGTSDNVLSKGIGHVPNSSLPIGGESSRSILTGHRGLASAKLFTRLDELKKDDLFFIHICQQTLAYQIFEIIEILPEDVEKLNIKPHEDIISLITCTPYGINTHRLVVSGKRIPYNPKDIEDVKPQLMSLREILFIFMPIIFILLFFFRIRKEKTYEKNN